MKEQIATIDSTAMGIIKNAEAEIKKITGNPVALVAYKTEN